MSLTSCCESLIAGNVPSSRFVITFDDGYADNLECAAPLLEAACVPATIFVTTEFTKQQREYWWDELERIILQTSDLPDTLSIEISGEQHTWEVRDSQSISTDSQKVAPYWNVLEDSPPCTRQALYCNLFTIMRKLKPSIRHDLVNQLREWASEADVIRKTHRPMTREQLQQLAKSDLLDIGAHTVSHQALSSLDRVEQHREIAQSKAFLEEVAGRQISQFSYPFGTRHDYGTETVEIVRDEGFHGACANFPGVVSNRSDVFQLPRILVRDWDGDTLLHRISEVTRVAT